MKNKNVELSYTQAKEIRKALSLAMEKMNCIEEEERFEVLSNLFDTMVSIEEEYEEEFSTNNEEE